MTFYQPELERALRARLADFPEVQVALGTELVSFAAERSGVRVEVRQADGRTATVQARFLIGADGANSFVRRHIGLDFQGKTFAQDWLVVDAQNVPNPIDHIEFLCDPRRPSPHMIAPEIAALGIHAAAGRNARGDREAGKIEVVLRRGAFEEITIERTAVYRFHARIVDRFSRGRVFLVGDAAHITPPFAGQGLVAGLRDVANLCWKLASVVQGRAAASILDSYDTERRPHFKRNHPAGASVGKLASAGRSRFGCDRGMGLGCRRMRFFRRQRRCSKT